MNILSSLSLLDYDRYLSEFKLTGQSWSIAFDTNYGIDSRIGYSGIVNGVVVCQFEANVEIVFIKMYQYMVNKKMVKDKNN